MENSSSRYRFTKITFLLTVALISLSFAYYQIAMLREVRYNVASGQTIIIYFALSLAYMGFGAMLSRLHLLQASLILLPCILPLSLVFLTTLNIRYILQVFDPQLQFVLATFLASPIYGSVFTLQGFILAGIFHKAREEGIISHAYAIDILMLGISEIKVALLTYLLEPIHMFAIAQIFAFLASFIFTGRKSTVTALLVSFGFLLIARMTEDRIDSSKFSTWTMYRRIDVKFGSLRVDVYSDSFLWYSFNRKPEHLEHDIRRLPFELKPDAKNVLIIGSGVGTDVYIAREVLPEAKITAVEIDSGFIDAVRKIDWLWDRYKTAEIVIADGAYFIKNDKKRYDLIAFAFADPGASISRIGFPDTNLLYTVETIKSAIQKLESDGVLVINRAVFSRLGTKFLGSICATLKEAGVDDFKLFLSQSFDYQGFEIKFSSLVIGKVEDV